MSKRSPEELYRVGLEAYGPDVLILDSGNHRMLRAFAAMLSQAVAPGKPKSKKEPTVGGPVMAAETLYAALRNQCGMHILSQPKLKTWVPGLAKAITNIEDWQSADIALLVTWINSGGLKEWPVKPSITHCVKWLGDWVAKARHASRGGLGRNVFEGALKCTKTQDFPKGSGAK